MILRRLLSPIVGALAPLILLAGCGEAPKEEAGEDFTRSSAAQRVSFAFDYRFALPPKAIAKVQRQHVTACERLGVARCRMVGISYSQQNSDDATASLDLRLAPSDAFSFANQGVDAVEAAKGEIETAFVKGEDAGAKIDQAEQGKAEARAEIARLEARLKQAGLSDGERRDLSARQEQLHQTLQQNSNAQREGEQSLATTPVNFSYASQGALNGENRFARAAMQSWQGLQTMAILIMVVLGYLVPWVLVAAVVLYLFRFVRKRVRLNEDTPEG